MGGKKGRHRGKFVCWRGTRKTEVKSVGSE